MDIEKLTDEDVIDLSKIDMTEVLKKRGYQMGWYKPVTYAGVIYILVNPAFPSLVKIGYADNLEKRIKVLNSNSGLPDPYHCYATYKVKKRLEDLQLHRLIDTLDSDLRHSANREFYEMSKEKAYGILSAIAQINGDENLLIVNPLSDAYFSDQVNNPIITDTSAIEHEEKKAVASRLKFKDLNIAVGSKLIFTEDETITVTVTDSESSVDYKGKVYKLSAAVRQIKRDLGTQTKSEAYQGGVYFKYEGETLVARRARMQSKTVGGAL